MLASCSTAASKVKQLEGPSDDDDLPQSIGVQTDELMTASPPSATSNESVPVLNPCTDFFLSLESRILVTVRLERQMIDIDYQCPICLEVFDDSLTEPYLTDCGHHLCGKCCDKLLNTSKTECPACRKQDMLNNARCDKYFQRLIISKNVQVSCSYYKEGCEWVGKLRHLHDHLDPTKGRCGIACPFGCSKFTHLSEMREHTCHCHNRTISCENCGYYNTLAIVTEKHNPICPRSPTAITPATVSSQYLYNQAPIEFTIGDFSEKKQANEEWHSSPFYTDNRGYKFRLSVHPNGINDGSGYHLSVQAEFMKGEFDDELERPFKGDIQIELLNWREDKNHHSAIICFNRYNHTMSHSRRCDTNQEVREAPTRVGQPDQFISHTDLEPTSDTKYLLGDFFKLRVSAAVYCTPPDPPTLSWQPRGMTPLSSHDDSDQPIIAQFTISEFSKRKQFNNIYFSPPFTTGPQGYKFSIKAFANGFSSGRGSNITMSAIIMKGQHDDHLKWPFTGTFIIEVLNWLEDKGHHMQVFSIGTGKTRISIIQLSIRYLSKDSICVDASRVQLSDPCC